MSTQQQTNQTYPVPIGSVFYFASQGAGGSFLLADGSAISRDEYWELFEYIGTGYGVGDGSTTFNLPDLMTFPFIQGAVTQTFIPPSSGGGSGSSGITIPANALPSLSAGNFSNNMTFSAQTTVNHKTMSQSSKWDVGFVGTNVVKTSSATGTGVNVSMNALTVSYSNPTPTPVSLNAGGTGLVVGSLQMVAYIKAFTNVGNKPLPKNVVLPPTPPSNSFFAPYQNIPYLSGLPIV